MNEQNGSASENSTVIQSGRDTVVGIGGTELKVILDSVVNNAAEQGSRFTVIAGEIVDRRIAEFEQKLLQRFNDSKKADVGAFKEPDFQYVVAKARSAYARNGDDTTCEMLVDLIAQRSKLESKSRLSLSLNQAIEKAAFLTKAEFSELSFSYLVTRAHAKGLYSFSDLAHFLDAIVPIGLGVADDRFSYEYLEAQSLGAVGGESTSVYWHVRRNYPALLSRGFGNVRLQFLFMLIDKYEPLLPLLFPSIHDKTRLQIFVADQDEFRAKMRAAGLSEFAIVDVWEAFEKTLIKEDMFWLKFVSHSKLYSLIQRLWKPPISRLKLTSVGVAIGHCYTLRQIPKYKFDISRSIE
jgi:hypothetical protein